MYLLFIIYTSILIIHDIEHLPNAVWSSLHDVT
jgi:hypothetical protein